MSEAEKTQPAWIKCPGCNCVIDAHWQTCPGCGRCPGSGDRRTKRVKNCAQCDMPFCDCCGRCAQCNGRRYAEITEPCPCGHPFNEAQLEKLISRFALDRKRWWSVIAQYFTATTNGSHPEKR